MKTFTLIIAVVLLTLSVNAQSPNLINYQAVARDGSGNLMANQNINIAFLVRKGSAAGTIVFEENHLNTSTNNYGLFSLQIGGGTNVSGSVAGINWAGDKHYLEVKVNGATIGAQQFVSVPYALLARDVENGGPSGTGTTNYVSKWTGSSSISNSQIFDNGTNVGIGTTSPSNRLHVIGYASFEPNFGVSGSRVDISSVGGGYVQLYLNNGTSNTVAFRSDGNSWFDAGYLGIGTTTPSSDLHIKQSIANFPNPTTGGITFEEPDASSEWQVWNSNDFLSFAKDNTRVAYVNGATGAWVTTSDRIFKKNIEPVESVLYRIGKLQAVKYHFNRQADSDSKNWGFIAQNVEESFPELVQYSEDGSELGLAYAEFSVLAIKAIQELKEEIEQLKREILLLKK